MMQILLYSLSYFLLGYLFSKYLAKPSIYQEHKRELDMPEFIISLFLWPLVGILAVLYNLKRTLC